MISTNLWKVAEDSIVEPIVLLSNQVLANGKSPRAWRLLRQSHAGFIAIVKIVKFKTLPDLQIGSLFRNSNTKNRPKTVCKRFVYHY